MSFNKNLLCDTKVVSLNNNDNCVLLDTESYYVDFKDAYTPFIIVSWKRLNGRKFMFCVSWKC